MQVIPVTQKDGVQRLCARVRGILDNFCPMDECKISRHIVALRKEKKICLVNLGVVNTCLQVLRSFAKAFLTFREMHNNRSLSVGLGNARSRRTIKRTWEFW